MAYAPSSKVDLGRGRGWLTHRAGRSIARIDRQLGHRMQISDAGRDWDQQNKPYQAYLRYLNGGPWAPIALNPDTPSVHQIGEAIDSDEAQTVLDILFDHGWRRTVYRWINGVWTLVERWHFEYFEHLDNHRHEYIELVNDNGTWRFASDMPKKTPPPPPRKKAPLMRLTESTTAQGSKARWHTPNGSVYIGNARDRDILARFQNADTVPFVNGAARPLVLDSAEQDIVDLYNEAAAAKRDSESEKRILDSIERLRAQLPTIQKAQEVTQ